jgi:nucleoside-diphosphate-sugar epimerase
MPCLVGGFCLRVVVTGGAGFIGSPLVRMLVGAYGLKRCFERAAPSI